MLSTLPFFHESSSQEHKEKLTTWTYPSGSSGGIDYTVSEKIAREIFT
jgi:hypothetical protein